MSLDLTSLSNAIVALEAAIKVFNEVENDQQSTHELNIVVQAGVIQHFEFTYELCWKFMKRYLENNLGSSYVDGVSRNQLFRLAAENHLIKNVESWMDYHKARNLTSHTYAEKVANEVATAAITFVSDAQEFLTALQDRNV